MSYAKLPCIFLLNKTNKLSKLDTIYANPGVNVYRPDWIFTFYKNNILLPDMITKD